MFILHLVTTGSNFSIASSLGAFFAQLLQSGFLKMAMTLHHSAVTKTRQKIGWLVFESMFYKAVDRAYQVIPKDKRFFWKGMSVYAVDGSKYQLPAAAEIREEFDPESGLEYEGKGHFPQGHVNTVFDVLRKFPVARNIVGIKDSDERKQLMSLLPRIPPGGVLITDRGYPSLELIAYLIEYTIGYFLMRCPTFNTFAAVMEFMRSGKDTTLVWLVKKTSSNGTVSFALKTHIADGEKESATAIRLIRVVLPDGSTTILITNMIDEKRFPVDDVKALYRYRWGIETNYRDEKSEHDIEKFHSRTCIGVRQELFAIAIMFIVSRVATILANLDTAEEQPIQAINDINESSEIASEHLNNSQNGTTDAVSADHTTDAKCEQSIGVGNESGNNQDVVQRLETESPAPTHQSKTKKQKGEPRFKSAVQLIGRHLVDFMATITEKVFQVLDMVFQFIQKIREYKPKEKRPNQPYTNKQPPNKWSRNRGEKQKPA